MVEDYVLLVSMLGFILVLLFFKFNGKFEYVKGFLLCFVKIVKNIVEFLNEVVLFNIFMVGVDVFLVLCYCDEYVKILGEDCGDFYVFIVNEWLVMVLDLIFVNVSKGV